MINTATTKLFLFTLHYPFGMGETFVENELKVLSGHFKHIYIFPLSGSGTSRNIPENAEVVNWEESYNYKGGKTLVRNFLNFTTIFASEIFRTGERKKKTKYIPELRSSLLQNFSRSEVIESFIKMNADTDSVFYTYWFDDWATVLGILKRKNIIPGYVSRAHGFDLFPVRRKGLFIPFRHFQMQTVKKVFSVSEAGKSYLCSAYPSSCSKVECSYLGVFNKGENPFSNDQVFTLVSCSNLVPVKRVHLIIEILKKVTINLHWVHFGDGDLMNDLKERSYSLPSNIKTDFKGQVKNTDILEFYKKKSVDLFINVSESEGIPVSIMEVISFGIPVAATNVGGVAEIVNTETGILLDPDFKADSVAEIINKHSSELWHSAGYRKGIRTFWLENFNAEKNYKAFYREITEE